jgi:hypothetical protein
MSSFLVVMHKYFLAFRDKNITITIIRNEINASIIDTIITLKIADNFIGTIKNKELISEKKTIKAINNII